MFIPLKHRAEYFYFRCNILVYPYCLINPSGYHLLLNPIASSFVGIKSTDPLDFIPAYTPDSVSLENPTERNLSSKLVNLE